jgi:AcrR family transcriptional regulator
MLLVESPAPSLRQRILEVAARRFAEHGYAATSVRQIAGDLAVTVPALYHHFRSKEAILEELVRRPVEVIDQLVDEVGLLPREERPRALLEGFLDRLGEHGALLVPMVKDPSVFATAAVTPMLALRRRMVDALAAAGSGPDADLRAAMVLAAVEGAVDAVAERSSPADLATALPRDEIVNAALRLM